MVRRRERLIPIICEICKEDDKATLHKHHIVDRKDPNTSNDDMNLAIVCSNCHNKIHHGNIEVIGVYPSTQLPYNRTLIYKIDGICNVPGIEDPYYKPQAKSIRIPWQK